jgi:hypothetical protein
LQRIYHVAFLKVLPSPEFSCKDWENHRNLRPRFKPSTCSIQV